jgi:hypothetical protein
MEKTNRTEQNSQIAVLTSCPGLLESYPRRVWIQENSDAVAFGTVNVRAVTYLYSSTVARCLLLYQDTVWRCPLLLCPSI